MLHFVFKEDKAPLMTSHRNQSDNLLRYSQIAHGQQGNHE